MAELNDKLITYGNLSTFYDKLQEQDIDAIYNSIYTLHPDADYLNFSANLPNTKVRLVLYSDYEAEPSTPIDIDYSFDRKNWVHYTIGNDITIPTDGKVYLRGNNDYFSFYDNDEYGDYLYYHYFEFENESENTLNVEAHGNINSLLSKTNWNEITTLIEFCYDSMFINCSSLTTAPALPATTLADYCYENMFNGCTSLTTAPALPANTLASYCYQSMFYYCTSLTTVPDLPVTTLVDGCYNSMFGNCTSLTTAPELPATTLASNCYQSMFVNCTSLTTAPELPATTLASYCYSNMFGNCTSLTTAPELPATELTSYCYQSMFGGCSSLTTAPELPATTLANNCYYNMFNGCTSLNYIKCFASDISASNCTNNWVDGVASAGTFVKAANMTGWTTGSNGIPTNWTVQDYTEPVVSEPIIIDESTFTGATLTVDGTQPSIVASGTTTIVWDDLAASIPSGKSVEVSVVLINTGNSALTPTMQGNYQMMGDGNLTIQASELGLYRGRYISALNKWLIEAIYQEVSGTAE